MITFDYLVFGVPFGLVHAHEHGERLAATSDGLADLVAKEPVRRALRKAHYAISTAADDLLVARTVVGFETGDVAVRRRMSEEWRPPGPGDEQRIPEYLGRVVGEADLAVVIAYLVALDELCRAVSEPFVGRKTSALVVACGEAAIGLRAGLESVATACGVELPPVPDRARAKLNELLTRHRSWSKEPPPEQVRREVASMPARHAAPIEAPQPQASTVDTSAEVPVPEAPEVPAAVTIEPAPAVTAPAQAPPSEPEQEPANDAAGPEHAPTHDEAEPTASQTPPVGADHEQTLPPVADEARPPSHMMNGGRIAVPPVAQHSAPPAAQQTPPATRHAAAPASAPVSAPAAHQTPPLAQLWQAAPAATARHQAPPARHAAPGADDQPRGPEAPTPVAPPATEAPKQRMAPAGEDLRWAPPSMRREREEAHHGGSSHGT